MIDLPTKPVPHKPDTRGIFVLGTAVANVIFAPMCMSWSWYAFAGVNPPDADELKNLMAVHGALKAYGHDATIKNLDTHMGVDFLFIEIPVCLQDTITVDSNIRGLRGEQRT